MKRKHTAQFGSFSLQLVLCSAAVCSMITGTVLAFFHPEAPAKATHPPSAGLTFAERVTYQRAIEEVYWRHRIWPKENSRPKPSLDEVMPQAQLEKKVADYLRKSQMVEDHWQRPITREQLQAEMDRMATHTKQPGVLHELFEALGNDPFVIAECLARQVLVERTLPTVASVRKWVAKPKTQLPVKMTALSANYTLPVMASSLSGCTHDTWTPIGLTDVPSGRDDHTAVWTGSEMIVWGGYPQLNTGGRYNPSTDSWTVTSTTNVPTGRLLHTAVWTGSEMIVWGGDNNNGDHFNTGGRYNPSTDNWTPTNVSTAPDPRRSHTAVWTGSEMIVWGGFGYAGQSNTGGR